MQSNPQFDSQIDMPIGMSENSEFTAGTRIKVIGVGGGGGNLVDRIHIGAVVDFLDFHWRNIHWPAFNLADVFIVCAALTWCLASLKASPRQPTRRTSEELPS